ncbi:MAG: 50S ribosomal protein L4, partial [Firmicutes bacterium]|nr:50S ribosomal protein L4 [Bacillota bacterium]
AEVSGGGKKPWRQKGTGRASFGSSRNPVWRKGGVAFGPTPRSHEISMPKKMRRLALLSALSSKAMDGDIVVLEDLDLQAPKTKELVRILNNIKAPNALVVIEQDNTNAVLSARNLPKVSTAPASGLNTYKVLYNEKLVLTRSSLASLEEVLG